VEYPKLNPMDLEPHYCRHVSAMTSERLHAKSDIAIQLAWRDAEIEALRDMLRKGRTYMVGEPQDLRLKIRDAVDGRP
jgi:hypothetical protein